ncbi:OLC1v1009443C1 [Oldenlandia corymbosa var. corymbosa]|uniref:OLC1v1009443C1 n=1 Tax=Oldenlandia corymbosa var. corymbosa TaxID=529605 RepID=A0AAV1DP66_OLDCO|nr:OLC1v1009443C1 [Oldenlandia corymbosa var. corymbosa]
MIESPRYIHETWNGYKTDQRGSMWIAIFQAMGLQIDFGSHGVSEIDYLDAIEKLSGLAMEGTSDPRFQGIIQSCKFQSHAGIITNAKFWVKQWPYRCGNGKLGLVFEVQAGLKELQATIGQKNVVYIVVPEKNLTVGQLKAAVLAGVRETYVICESLEPLQIDEIDGIADYDIISGKLQSGKTLTVRGFIENPDYKFIFQGKKR